MDGSTAASARCAFSSSARPTRTPSLRMDAVSRPSRSVTIAPSTSDTFEHLELTDAFDVLVHFEHDAKSAVEVVRFERQQGTRPVNRLADPRQLVELLIA